MGRDSTRNSFGRVIVFNQYNLVFLGAAAAYSLALPSRWPAIVAAGCEILWVGFALSSTTVRRWAIKHMLEQDRADRVARTAPMLKELEPVYAARVEALEVVGADIRRLVRECGLDAALRPLEGNHLEALLTAFTEMAMLHQRLSSFTKHAKPAQLEEEIVGLGQSFATEQNSSIRFLLSQALSMAQGRFEKQEQLESQLRMLSVKMGTLELSLDYLRSHIFGGRSEQALAGDVAQLLANLSFLSDLEAAANPATTTTNPAMTAVTQSQALGGS
jgi:hypothetical protein